VLTLLFATSSSSRTTAWSPSTLSFRSIRRSGVVPSFLRHIILYLVTSRLDIDQATVSKSPFELQKTAALSSDSTLPDCMRNYWLRDVSSPWLPGGVTGSESSLMSFHIWIICRFRELHAESSRVLIYSSLVLQAGSYYCGNPAMRVTTFANLPHVRRIHCHQEIELAGKRFCTTESYLQ
jgi:hypothetical protein